MIKNIFLYAGGVILNETEFENKTAEIVSSLLNEYTGNYTIENYWSDVNEAIYRFIYKQYNYVIYKNLKNSESYYRVFKEYKQRLNDALAVNGRFVINDGLKDLLEKLSVKYNIGILGQYGIDFKNYLSSQGLLQYFTFSEIQDDYNVTKPDTRYYTAILEKCNCRAEESIMVGDRMDKDIIPAKMVGMKTILFKTGLHKNMEPVIPEQIPDLTVYNLNEITMEKLSLI
jgi:HAD superfamily hydrolase (TIGR01549 family)